VVLLEKWNLEETLCAQYMKEDDNNKIVRRVSDATDVGITWRFTLGLKRTADLQGREFKYVSLSV